jgi:alanyl-tRNA synthetase
MLLQNGEVLVEDVQELSGYVVHTGTISQGTLAVGDQVTAYISQVQRELHD